MSSFSSALVVSDASKLLSTMLGVWERRGGQDTEGG